MYVEITFVWQNTPMALNVSLNYYNVIEDEKPVYTDELNFALSDMIGDPPEIQLHNPERLRGELYNRIQRVESSITNLKQMHFLLSQLTPGHKMSQGEVLRMLEGALG